ncbi:MAG: hypothetical protein WB626_11200 [Bacteroidota bacterium]
MRIRQVYGPGVLPPDRARLVEQTHFAGWDSARASLKKFLPSHNVTNLGARIRVSNRDRSVTVAVFEKR